MINEKGMTSKTFTNYSAEIVNRDFISKVRVREAIETDRKKYCVCLNIDKRYDLNMICFSCNIRNKLLKDLGIVEK